MNQVTDPLDPIGGDDGSYSSGDLYDTRGVSYALHNACEFHDVETLRSLIFVPKSGRGNHVGSTLNETTTGATTAVSYNDDYNDSRNNNRNGKEGENSIQNGCNTFRVFCQCFLCVNEEAALLSYSKHTCSYY